MKPNATARVRRRRKKKGKRKRCVRSPFKYGDKHKYAVDPETECWIWMGARQNGRYGAVRDPSRGNKVIGAHVFFFEQATGVTVPDGMEVDHVVCDNGLCVNPEHMALATRTDNSVRGNGKRWGTLPHRDNEDVPF